MLLLLRRQDSQTWPEILFLQVMICNNEALFRAVCLSFLPSPSYILLMPNSFFKNFPSNFVARSSQLGSDYYKFFEGCTGGTPFDSNNATVS